MKNNVKKLYNYELTDEKTWGVGTEEEIKEISKEAGYPVWFQTLASYEDVLDYLCLGEEIPEVEFFEVKNGFIIFNLDTLELDFYSDKDVCAEMLPGVLETYF